MDNKIILEDVFQIVERVDLKPLQNKQILITGATGLIGTYILYTLYAYKQKETANYDVTIVAHNNLPAHLQEFNECSWVKILFGDLTEEDFLEKLPEYDVIIHGAGYGQPGKFMDKKVKTLMLNSKTTEVLLRKVKEHGKFLFLSTSELYSGSKEFPYSEVTHGVTMPDHPRACYIEGKRCGETLCHIYNETGKIDAKIARIALAYGPGCKKDDKRVLYNFISKAAAGDIEMLDAGQAHRVYCYIADTVELLFDILLKGKEVVYNVGGVSETTIYKLACLVGNCFGRNVVCPELSKGLEEAPNVVSMDISKICNEFKKSEFVDLVEGVSRTVGWYKQYFEQQDGFK